ncbi:hypothetical protein [Planococcus lenghuensis]|uniref:DUF3006 domain-containing protein n=1 Tax=Planococcus lenghuensis TaxID=2213202 RepID=A0A1Q2L4A7_9BACL|nr:hypothetical protein [Planococcus lenghuensis]AQQ55223.1 hypothetical protein B0X71_18740 [Planococcus lenghuensis]AQQ55280.1 hypothetical protein B0X71_19055 [Planococcus lenghuensis]
MKDGKYKVGSVEQGIVKILLVEDESIEEQLPASAFPAAAPEGLVLQVTSDKETVTIMPLFEETQELPKQAEKATDELEKHI